MEKECRISIDEIKVFKNSSMFKKIEPEGIKWNKEGYIGLDFHQDGIQCKKYNLNFLSNFINHFPKRKTHLIIWKGSVELYDDNDAREWYDLLSLSGYTSEELVKRLDEWLLKQVIDELDENNKYFVSNEISRVITREDRYTVLKRQNWRCNNCSEVLKMSKHSSWKGEVAHIDHIHPFSKKCSYPNGEQNINELENLQGLCPKCNLSKGKKEIN